MCVPGLAAPPLQVLLSGRMKWREEDVLDFDSQMAEERC